MKLEITKKIAKAFGYELMKSKKHPTLTSHIKNLINHYEIDLVLDVGANNGQFGKKLRNEGYKGEIHSFEPVSKTFEYLSKVCLDDQKWFAHKIAMGDACGEQIVNITESSVLSSILNPNDFGEERFKDIKVLDKETVNVSTIDSFLATQIKDFDKRRIFLKMDTQGYDLKVFEGALNSLKYIACILSEISFLPIYSGMPHYLDSLRKYEDNGFIVTGLYPVSRKDNLSVIEMDCMLINNKKI